MNPLVNFFNMLARSCVEYQVEQDQQGKRLENQIGELTGQIKDLKSEVQQANKELTALRARQTVVATSVQSEVSVAPKSLVAITTDPKNKDELWRELVVPGRKVYISSFGRVKFLDIRSGVVSISKQLQHPTKSIVNCNVRCHFPNIIHKTANDRPVAVLSVAKTVLLAFADEPSWKDDCPLTYARSTQCYAHLDGDRSNCNISNLRWVDSFRARQIETSMKASCKEGSEYYHHLAPFNGDYRYLNKKNPKKSGKVTVVTPEPTVAPKLEPIFESSVTWKDVPAFVGFYQVSTEGQVRSLDRYVRRYGGRRMNLDEPQYLTQEAIETHNKRNYRFCRGRVLSPVKLQGELAVTLCRDGVAVPVPVAQVVVESFIGAGHVYYFKDGNYENCALSNLALVS